MRLFHIVQEICSGCCTSLGGPRAGPRPEAGYPTGTSFPPVRSTHTSYRLGLDSALVFSPTPSLPLPPRISSGARWRLAWPPQLPPSTPSFPRRGASRDRSSSCPLCAAPAPRPPGSCRQSSSRWLRSVRLRPYPAPLRAASLLPTHRRALLLMAAVTLQLFHLALLFLGNSPRRLPPCAKASIGHFRQAASPAACRRHFEHRGSLRNRRAAWRR